ETAELRPESVYGETKLATERLLHWLSVTQGLRYAAVTYFNAAGAAGGRGEGHRPGTHRLPLVPQAALRGREPVTVFGADAPEPAGAAGGRAGARRAGTHLIPPVLRAALGRLAEGTVFGTAYPTPDGTAVRDYVHVEAPAAAHVLALEALEPGRGAAYNLGTGAGFSVREVIDACRRVTGVDLRVREGPRRAGDPPVLVADASRAAAELGWRPRHTSLDAIVASAWEWHRSHPEGYAA